MQAKALPSSDEKIELFGKLRAISNHGGGTKWTDAEETTPQIVSESRQLEPCEICVFVNDALWKFECKFQYDLSTKDSEQRQFAKRGGFCAFHTWQYHRVASPYGICGSYPHLLSTLAARLRSLGQFADRTRGELRLSPWALPPIRCIMCDTRGAAETEAISQLARKLYDGGDAAIDTVSAICISHLVLLTSALSNPELVSRLLNREATLLQRLSEDMKRFLLKRDAARPHLETVEEVTVAQRALLLVGGHSNIAAGSQIAGSAAEELIRCNNVTDFIGLSK